MSNWDALIEESTQALLTIAKNPDTEPVILELIAHQDDYETEENEVMFAVCSNPNTDEITLQDIAEHLVADDAMRAAMAQNPNADTGVMLTLIREAEDPEAVGEVAIANAHCDECSETYREAIEEALS
ncbi:hypothetical protein ACWG8W_06120 [Citricoccus zhacaiensis]